MKADGLAAGKGVLICETHESAIAAASGMLEGSFGAAGSTIVIEEFLRGEEVSFIVVAGGGRVVPLATSQDHKRRDDGDQGPNTGGMGAYSPAPIVDARIARAHHGRGDRTHPARLASRRNSLHRFLYAGLMIAQDGTPNVLEFNCRFGDPEAQPILMRLQSDLPDLCEAALAGSLDEVDVRWDPRAALGVVMAAGGYPDRYRTGDPISGLEVAARLPGKVFHAGTRSSGRKSSRRAGACCARWVWARRSARRSARPMTSCTRSIGVWFNTGATSAIERSRGSKTRRSASVDRAVLRFRQEEQRDDRRRKRDRDRIPETGEDVARVDHQCRGNEGQEAAQNADAEMVGYRQRRGADLRRKHLDHECGHRPVRHADQRHQPDHDCDGADLVHLAAGES